MNESHEKLYNLLSTEGLYTKSYEDFTAQFESPEKQQKLYELILNENLYTKSYDEFTEQFFVKKKDSPSELSAFSSLGFGGIGGLNPAAAVDFNLTIRQFTDDFVKEREEKKIAQAGEGAAQIREDYGFDPLPYVQSYFNTNQYDRREDKEAIVFLTFRSLVTFQYKNSKTLLP